eukprot:10321-Heterococcus_DN1.PRE.1
MVNCRISALDSATREVCFTAAQGHANAATAVLCQISEEVLICWKLLRLAYAAENPAYSAAVAL